MAEQLPQSTQHSIDGTSLERFFNIAKWFIPSFTALYLLVGYVAAQGHFALLGFSPGLLASTSYNAVTIDFVRESLAVVVTSWRSWWALFTAPLLLSVAVPALALAAVALFWPSGIRVRQQPEAVLLDSSAVRTLLASASAVSFSSRKLSLLPWLLLAVVCSKALLLDAPLFKLEGALIDLAEPTKPGSAAFPLSARLERESGGVQAIIAKRAGFLWEQLVCVRTGRQATATVSFKSASCQEDRTRHADRIDAEFLTHLLSVVAVALVSLVILRDPLARSSSALLAILCLLSCLTLPYAYGKLRHSTEYEFGEIALKTALNLNKGGAEGEVRTLKGFGFIRDGNTTVVATLQPVPCPPPSGAYKTEVKLWRISNNEIHWQREIYREDILRWKLLKESDNCTGVDAP